MIIAFGGAPNAGVTTTALKAAQVIYEKTKQRVIFVSLDREVPMLDWMVSSESKKEKVPDLGDLLETDVIGREGIVRHTYIEEKRPNFGILAFKKRGLGKTLFISKENAQLILKRLKEIAAYVVVDCGRIEEYMAQLFWENATKRITVVDASLKSFSYYRMQNPNYNTTALWAVALSKRDEMRLKALEKRFFKENLVVLGYCGRIREQEEKGMLLEWLPGCQYKSRITDALREVWK